MFQDQIMDVVAPKRNIPSERGQPSKRGRSLPSPSHSEVPKPSLIDGKEFNAIAEDFPDVEGTTLLKAVPFDLFIRDYQKEVDAIIERLSKEKVLLLTDDDGTKHFLDLADDLEILELCGVGDDIWPYSTGPVLQVIHVTISNSNHFEDFKIYGEISMTDYKRDTFYIYKCEPEEPEFVMKGDPHLYLTDCPIVPAMGGKVKFSLTNKNSNIQIFDTECDVKDATEDTEEETFTLICDGISGYVAKMVFTKIPFAIIAKVEMFLRYTPPPRPGEYNTSFFVEGDITANKAIVINRWSRQEMESEKRNLFTPYRYVFAASVFSSLDVKVKLYNDGLELADDTYKVSTCPGSMAMPRNSEFKCKAEECYFEMDVDWIPHDDFFRHSDVQWMSYMSDPNVGPPGLVMREIYEPVATDSVEVFSVLIGGVSAPHDVCGTIVVRDAGGKVYIFARNTNCPDKLSLNEQPFRTVSLAWPDRWFQEKNLYMHLKLKDVQDRVVCRGHLSWRTGHDGRYDRRLCDIIQSEDDCFAAVHYSVFKNGKKARLSVKCIDGGPYFVYGSVFAQYDNHDYPSPYDEQCYRSTIFRRSKEERVKVENGSEVLLSKSYVSAPSDCKQLIVVADLWAVHPNRTSYKHATGNLLFEANESQSEDLGGCFVVTVNWSQ